MFGSRILGLGGLFNSERTYESEAGHRLNQLILHNQFMAEQEMYHQKTKQKEEPMNITPKTKLIEEKPCRKNS